MPIYEYQCKKCKHRFEKIQKFSDKKIRKCPECGGPVEQLVHAPAVQFKGSGWYVTDYAGKKTPTEGAPASGTDGAASKAGDKTESKKTDSKPEPKTETKSNKEK